MLWLSWERQIVGALKHRGGVKLAAMNSTDDPLAPPALAWFADLRVEVGVPQLLSRGPHGLRRLVPITGGEAHGDGWRARVLPGGADFQWIPSDTLSVLDARYGLETEAGELIYVRNHAVRSAAHEVMAKLMRGEPVDPGAVYFRCSPRFETAAPALAWIGEKLFVGSGMRHPDSVVMRFFALI